jgi:hypothetical protein
LLPKWLVKHNKTFREGKASGAVVLIRGSHNAELSLTPVEGFEENIICEICQASQRLSGFECQWSMPFSCIF